MRRLYGPRRTKIHTFHATLTLKCPIRMIRFLYYRFRWAVLNAHVTMQTTIRGIKGFSDEKRPIA